ncbi:MAG: Lrp/AsnC ligand binding domain-containing protein [Candidatus Hodarchaeales archaeon]|jgi:DNA-binding Lrp family transcriptional regulator
MALLYVLMKCKTGTEKNVKSSLTEMELVERVDIVTGEYDLIVRLKAKTSGKLQSAVLGRIRNIPNIIQTVSLPVIELS